MTLAHLFLIKTCLFHICSLGNCLRLVNIYLLQNTKLKRQITMYKYKVSLDDSCQICQFSSVAGIEVD